MTEQEQFAVFLEIHTGNAQEGPGNFTSSRQAFSALTDLPDNPSILDAGCGPGRQTLDLARISNGNITAVDTLAAFVTSLQETIQAQGLAGRLTAVQGDMEQLQFEPRSFDVIWSEGAIYNIGFEHGLCVWQPLLKPGGYVAVSELSWLKADAPEALRTFWNDEYPGMRTVEQNCAAVRNAGYQLVDHFTLPESAWWDYYGPIEKRIQLLREKYAQNQDALEVLDRERQEIENYRQYSDYYGYVFYIGRLV